jgi:hypothetical protein
MAVAAGFSWDEPISERGFWEEEFGDWVETVNVLAMDVLGYNCNRLVIF